MTVSKFGTRTLNISVIEVVVEIEAMKNSGDLRDAASELRLLTSSPPPYLTVYIHCCGPIFHLRVLIFLNFISFTGLSKSTPQLITFQCAPGLPCPISPFDSKPKGCVCSRSSCHFCSLFSARRKWGLGESICSTIFQVIISRRTLPMRQHFQLLRSRRFWMYTFPSSRISQHRPAPLPQLLHAAFCAQRPYTAVADLRSAGLYAMRPTSEGGFCRYGNDTPEPLLESDAMSQRKV